MAARYEVAPATLALAWVMAQPGIIAPIASATSVEQLKALVEAAKLNLDQPARDLLDKASAEPAVASEAGTAA
ncbi:MAG: aldo/keto reductase [Methylococcaceae bacterium]|nr:aldo/keto reductase [Methylococcaceae bacterium]